jgi:hypothetical protein
MGGSGIYREPLLNGMLIEGEADTGSGFQLTRKHPTFDRLLL